MTATIASLIAAIVFVRASEVSDGAKWLAPDVFSEILRCFIAASSYFVFFFLTWRPVTSLVLSAFLFTGLAIANRVKKTVVFEPITFSDLGLLGQILRHPKLYYLDRPLIVGPPLVALACGIALAFSLEQPILPWAPGYFALAAIWIGLFIRAHRIRVAYRELLNSQEDGWGSAQLGLATSIVLQFVGWIDWIRQLAPTAALTDKGQLAADCDIVVIQLESFEDMTAPSAMSRWRELQRVARFYGPLDVPARGANTMRTEHAVLSGLPNAALQLDRFDPYLRRPGKVHGHFERLRKQGWRTVFIHPNDLSFFRRDRALPSLGFDELIGRERFRDDPPIGPYIGDAAVVRELISELERSATPVALFAVTMENHGPWGAKHLPGVGGGIAAYLEHQKNTDRALAQLLDYLTSADRRTLVVLYGDHRPALAELSDDPSWDTDYVIIDTGDLHQSNHADTPLSAEGLLKLAFELIARQKI